jgi:hypothetical protein
MNDTAALDDAQSCADSTNASYLLAAFDGQHSFDQFYDEPAKKGHIMQNETRR